VVIANRTVARGLALAERFGGTAIRLEELGERLWQFDIVVSCTASPLPIIGLGMVERAIKMRRHRPMFMVDLAVPRDIEPEVGDMDDVFLYTVDDLAQVVESGLESRQAAVVDAEAIIAERVEGFLRWLATRGTVPVIRSLRDAAERSRRHEMEHALKSLARGDDPARVLEQFSHRLTNKFLHAPTQALSQAGRRSRRVAVAGDASFSSAHGFTSRRVARLRLTALPPRRRFFPAFPREPIFQDFPMNQSICDKLEQLTGRLDELDRMLASGEATRDLDDYRKLSREHAELGPGRCPLPVLAANQGRPVRRRLEMLADPEMRELAEAEVDALRERLPEIEADLQKLLLPKDANDDRNVFLEIRAGTGGDESALFAGRSVSHVHALCRAPALAGRGHVGEPQRFGRLQGSHRPHHR
jgi:hypothetical protein